MSDHSTFLNDLRSLPATVTEVDYARRGYHLDVSLGADKVREMAETFLRHEFYLVFESAVDMAPDAEVVYQFARHSSLCRVMVRTYVRRDGTVPTIADIFHGANWHERETKDMYGIRFEGHPYPQPLLLPEENADLKPLKKSEKAVKLAADIRWQPEAPAPAAPAKPAAPKAGETQTTPEQG